MHAYHQRPLLMKRQKQPSEQTSSLGARARRTNAGQDARVPVVLRWERVRDTRMRAECPPSQFVENHDQISRFQTNKEETLKSNVTS
jgi:hypothetical protein